MHGPEKSDSVVVAGKPTNKAERSVAEPVEPRTGTKGNADQQSTRRAQDRVSVSQALERVRQAARQKKKERFTALLHHVAPAMLRTAFYALKRDAAPGIDGMTWEAYEADLDRRIEELHARVKSGAYRALPSRRSYIPKEDGGKRVIRLVQKWLRAGVLEDGIVTIEEKGTGQGSEISPLLANVYLHYVFDLWAERWRRREATGDMIIVRYADDTVIGFEREADARRFWDAMRKRFEEFSLSFNPDKTRLIEFGRFAAQNREKRGLGKPGTFTFLGFVLICGKSRRGDFQIRRKSRRDRMRTKLREVKEGLRQRRHGSIPETGNWLGQIVAGYFAYHAVPTNSAAIGAFRYHVTVLWYRQLCRRSQKARLVWSRMAKLADEFLPKPQVLHPWASARFAVRTRGRSRVPELGSLGSGRGAFSNERPYRERPISAIKIWLPYGSRLVV